MQRLLATDTLIHVRPALPTPLLAGLCLVGMLLAAAAAAQQTPLRIGVLAKRGEARALERWRPTAEYLSEAVTPHRFEVVPLGFDEIHLAVRQRRIDFVLANPAFYVELEGLYGVSRIATLKNLSAPGRWHSVFGGVLFTRAERDDIRRLEDLEGKRLAAVDRGSFGGWIMAWRELERRGIDPREDLAGVSFAGTHDAVVYAVVEGEADAGTVRTDTLERMAAEGKVDLSQLFVLEQRRVADFPLLLSTPLYPEWPFAKVQGVSDELATRVAVALMQMPRDHPAAIASQCAGWTIPLNYQPVHEALRELALGPYRRPEHIALARVIAQYWRWILAAALVLLATVCTALYVVRLNRRLRAERRQVRALNTTLEARVDERTRRVQALLDREHYLRAILKTVADINQILITADDLNELLKGCCDRLVGHSEYRFAWIGLREGERVRVASKSYGAGPQLIGRLLAAAGEGGLPMASPLVGALADNAPLLINDLSDGARGKDWREVFGEPELRSLAALPLRRDAVSAPLGQLCVLSARAGGFEPEEAAMLGELAGDIGFAIHAFRQTAVTERLQAERVSNYEETILSMIDMIEQRDTYTAGHARRVAAYCERIAAGMGRPREEIERLKKAAILHDIGKIATPDSVLLKPARLVGLEYDLIKEHVTVGYAMLARIAMYSDLAEIMRYHHERYDGNGYPGGLQGQAIPLLSRIMAVADAFDAMTTHRIYKPRKEVPTAIAELLELAGSQFDPQVAKVAARVLADVTPPLVATQLPTSDVEKERFAYFFNDQLTGAFNVRYLQFLLRSGLYRDYGHACLVYLTGFSRYNRVHGWSHGDALLREVADLLRHDFPGCSVFRVFGDDFVLLSRDPLVPDADRLSRESALQDSGVAARVECLALDEGGVQRLGGML